MNETKSKEKSVYFVYTLMFAFFSLAYFGWAFFSDYTLIDDSDNLSQHYKAFVYYGEYLRNALKTVFVAHSLDIPQFDINIGEGSDILQSLCYYVIGDPFALFSVFSPKETAYILFGFVNLARLYAAGLSFVYMCRSFGQKDALAILAGMCGYILTPFALNNVTAQVFFINPFIFLPLLVVGVNKILNKESPVLYVLTVFFAALSNFYFFYMLALLIAVYGAVKSIVYQKDFKAILIFAAKCFAFALLAVMMAGFLLLPTLYFFTHDTRAAGHSLKLFYSILDYAKMPFSLTSDYGNPSWGVHIVFALIAFFTPLKCKFVKKEEKLLRVLFLIMILCIVFPFISQILNGFSYPTTRWMFAFYLLTSYIIVHKFEGIQSISIPKATLFLAFNALYCLAIAAIKNGSLAVHLLSLSIQTAIGAVFLCSLKLFGNGRAKTSGKALPVFLLVIESTSALSFVYLEKNTIPTEVALKSILDNDATRVKKIARLHAEDEFFRFSQTGSLPRHADNISPIAGISSTQYYWTLSNPGVTEFGSKLEIIDGRRVHFHGLDARPISMDLANVLYFCQQDEQTIPPLYHYKKTERENIYKNEDFLPFGYTYSNFIEKTEWEKLNCVEKEAILPKAVVLEQSPKRIPHLADIQTDVANADFSVDYDEAELEWRKDAVVSKKENSVLKMRTNVSGNKLAFIKFSSLDFKKKRMPEWTTILVSTNTGYSKKFDVLLPDHSYFIYTGIQDYMLNLGHFTADEPLTDIRISFSHEGEYTFSDLSLIVIPMEGITESLQDLRKDTLQNVRIETNAISGDTTLNEPKILCISVPYLEGWTAFVDGREQKLLRANVKHMGLELDAGEHRIELRYHTPFLKAGILISILGWIGFVIFIIKMRRMNAS